MWNLAEPLIFLAMHYTLDTEQKTATLPHFQKWVTVTCSHSPHFRAGSLCATAAAAADLSQAIVSQQIPLMVLAHITLFISTWQ